MWMFVLYTVIFLHLEQIARYSTVMVIQGDFFGMVKQPFKGLSNLQLRSRIEYNWIIWKWMFELHDEPNLYIGNGFWLTKQQFLIGCFPPLFLWETACTTSNSCRHGIPGKSWLRIRVAELSLGWQGFAWLVPIASMYAIFTYIYLELP